MRSCPPSNRGAHVRLRLRRHPSQPRIHLRFHLVESFRQRDNLEVIGLRARRAARKAKDSVQGPNAQELVLSGSARRDLVRIGPVHNDPVRHVPVHHSVRTHRVSAKAVRHGRRTIVRRVRPGNLGKARLGPNGVRHHHLDQDLHVKAGRLPDLQREAVPAKLAPLKRSRGRNPALTVPRSSPLQVRVAKLPLRTISSPADRRNCRLRQ